MTERPYKPRPYPMPLPGIQNTKGPSLDLNFMGATALDSRITFTRASIATDSFYTDAAGSSYNLFTANVPRLTSLGLIIEESRVNSLLNSDTPATQTTASLAIGTYTLWVIGTGSATSSAGTATGTGFGTATAGVPNVIVLSVAGTVTITVSGSLTRFQLELGAFPLSYIPTTGATVTRIKEQAVMNVSQSWLNVNAGTFLCEVYTTFRNTTENTELFSIHDGSLNNRLFLQSNLNSATIQANSEIGGVLTSANNGSANTVGQVNKLAIGYTLPSGILFAKNGATGIGSAAVASASTWTKLGVGNSSVSNNVQFNDRIQRLRYYPRLLSQAEMNAKTT